ncbi:MAG: hypothetical protein ACJAQ3_003199 [Planctomycetota bacterium]|jgi:hypothetical protein
MSEPTTEAPTMRALAARVLHKVLEQLALHEGPVRRKAIMGALPELLELSEWDLEEVGKSSRPRWQNAIWYTTDAVKAGFMVKSGRGLWAITEEGRDALDMTPTELLEAAMEGYRDWQSEKSDSGEGTDGRGPGAWARSVIMRDGLRLLAQAPAGTMDSKVVQQRLPAQLPDDLIEELDQWRSDWRESYLFQTFTRPSRADWLKRARTGEWTITGEGRRALEEFPDAMELWKAARLAFRGPGEDDQKLPYLGEVHDFGQRPSTLYLNSQLSVDQVVKELESGSIALPDIQRPFVWKNTKVRDLLDSMYRGFPFGYILTWKSPAAAQTKSIGTDRKQAASPHALVIDGQQRLTSLYAVMTGKLVLDSNFNERKIRIAFHPISGAFEVADASRRNNPEWISDLSDVFTDPQGTYAITQRYLQQLEVAREIDDSHRQAAQQNIQRLFNLRNSALVVLEISAEADEEQVADIFVRINSKGQNLKQADFILTLLAVFWEEGRTQLEDFARDCRMPPKGSTPSPFNRQLQPGADEMVRVSIAVGHRRARLSAAYQVLRGKDPKKNVVTEEARQANLKIMRDAQAAALDVGNWHEFLKTLSVAGYKGDKQILSMNTSLYAYSLFLLGRTQYGVPLDRLRSVIARWFMMAVLTGRYVGGSSETAMEEDLARLRTIADGDPDPFCEALERAMASELTNDFWSVTLPSRLESSSIRSAEPFFAAQSVLGAKALFSDLTVAELRDPSHVSTKSHVEVHHLFPKNWLVKNGFPDRRHYNQVANYALLEWSENISVSDKAPAVYAPSKFAAMDAAERKAVLEANALPDNWWELGYVEFLEVRRKGMAAVIRRAFEKLR